MAKKKYRIFSDVTEVSRNGERALKEAKLLNRNGTVISWTRLAPWLVGRELSDHQAKQLVLVELGQDNPRSDLITRLVNYLSYAGKEQTMERINKMLE